MNQESNHVIDPSDLVTMVADIVSAYVSYNNVPASELPGLIRTVHKSLNMIDNAETQQSEPQQEPAVPVRRSIHDDYLVCLEDGKKLKMLKRYLRTRYNMTPDDYRRKWSLPADYPMVAPNYSSQRSNFAKKIGLGRHRAA